MDIPFQYLLEFALGGILLYASIRSQLSLFTGLLKRLFKRRHKWIAYVTLLVRLVLGIVAGHLLINPFIVGQAKIQICAPKKYPTVLENLRVRISPLRPNGSIAPERLIYSKFSDNGCVSAIVTFHFFEQYVEAVVYDITQPKNSLFQRVERLSPYARRGLSDKQICFD